MNIECEVCGNNPIKDSGVILTRINDFGIPPIWRCQEHTEDKHLEGIAGEQLYFLDELGLDEHS